MSPEEEARLIELARTGDHAAFGALHAAYLAPVVTRLSHLCGPGGGVEDLVQETFLRAYRALPGFRGSCPFRFWLLRIATHLARSQRRSFQRALFRLFASDEEEASLSPSAPGSEAELYPELRALHAALDHLSPRLREAVILFDLEGRTLAEIAAELGTPLHTIAARVRRGRAALRARLESPRGRPRRTLLPCTGEHP